jgi:LmbE family N-acetylglucosaminyl deacetylase
MRVQVMVVAAHPDDIDRHCGGAVARWIRDGDGVVFVLCTSGNRGSDDAGITLEQLAALREAEQREAAAILGVTEVVFLRHEDGDLPFVMPQLREALVRLLRTYRPERVLTHDPFVRSGSLPYQLHADHRAAGDVAIQAAYPCAGGPLFYPEQVVAGLKPHKVRELYLFMTDTPDTFVDVTDTFATKLQAVRAHRSQHSEAIEQRLRERAEALGRAQGMPLAEGFKHVVLL